MKKIIIHSDGTKEEIEGTAEELAEYERKMKSETPKKGNGKKVLLDGIDLQEFMRELQKVVSEKRTEYYPFWIPYYPLKLYPEYPYYPERPYIFCESSSEVSIGTQYNGSCSQLTVGDKQ